MATELHISISAERISAVGPLNISNSILTSLIVSALLLLFFFAVRKNIRPSMKKPGRLQNLAEMMVQGVYGVVQGITGDHKKTRFFMPFFLAFFLFILANNWFGLLPGVGTIGFRETAEGTEHAVLLQRDLDLPAAPVQAAQVAQDEHAALEDSEGSSFGLGVTEETPHEETAAAAEDGHSEEGVFVPYLRAGTADLNTTMALAIFTMVMVQVIGVKYQGLAYFKKFLNFKNPIMFFVSVLETISEIAKVISFSFRLFGNIFAGEVLLVVVGSLIPLIVPMPFYGLELFVGMIQALVFSLLSVVFFNVATVGHDDH